MFITRARSRCAARGIAQLAAPAAAALALMAGPASATTYNWNTGLFSVGGTAPSPLAAGDTLSISAGAGKQFLGVAFVNDGTVLLQPAAGLVYLSSAASVTNNGWWEDLGAASISTGNAAGGTFTNNGTFRKSAGGTSYLVPNSLINTGTIDVQQGTLILQNSQVNDGTMTGDGTLQSFGGLTNNGTVAPGSVGVGDLSVFGGYSQSSSGTLAIDLTSASSFDSLAVTGAVSLDGVLALNCVACNLAIGETVTILDGSGSLTGSFSSISMTGFATGAFDVIYDRPNAMVSLVATQTVSAVPEPASLALMLAGIAGLGALTRRRQA